MKNLLMISPMLVVLIPSTIGLTKSLLVSEYYGLDVEDYLSVFVFSLCIIIAYLLCLLF